MKGTRKKYIFKRILVIGILTLVGIFVVGGMLVLQEKNYIGRRDSIKYRKYLQVYEYDKMLIEKGKPINELLVEAQIGDSISKEWLVIYNGMLVVFVYNEEKGMVGREANIQIISEKYSFGWKKIKVGDDRSKIEKVFKNSKYILGKKVHLYDEQGKVRYEEITCYYSDNYECGIGFSYNEQDRVETIMVILGGL